MMRYSSVVTLLVCAVFRTSAASYIHKNDLPDGDWVSYSSEVEFLPTNGLQQLSSQSFVLGRQLAQSKIYNPYAADPFVEGESEYDEYQQAWRLLGFLIDCNDWSRWQDDDAYNNGSGDAGTEDGCRRYVLWAAYIDLEYEGGGIGEYQFWDRNNQKWDDTSCQYAEGGDSRCARMDCHLEDTHWSLLGFFKHKSPDDWMEQLFKHEGMCVWTEEEYSFMGSARKAWPQGCIESSTTDSSGNPIYYNIKPISGGSITLGLYTDTKCVKEYQSGVFNDPITVENVLGNLLVEGGSGSQDNSDYESYSLDQTLAVWDSAFDIFKICQPCVAYDLNNYGYNTDDDGSRGSSYGTYTYGYDDDSYAGGGADFDCYDDAGYTNVNQCMKFMAKTSMDTASIRDVALAARQGTLVDQLPVDGLLGSSRRFGPPKGFDVVSSIIFLLASCGIFVYGVIVFRKVRKDANFAPKWSLKQPLVFA